MTTAVVYLFHCNPLISHAQWGSVPVGRGFRAIRTVVNCASLLHARGDDGTDANPIPHPQIRDI
jgi:hypothetical protein